MLNKLNQLLRKNFVKNVSAMATGTIAAQFVTIASSPIITRLYGPEAFGVLGVFTALINILSPISALSYPISIVLPNEKQKAIQLIKLSLIIAFLLSTLMLLVITLFKDAILDIFQLEQIGDYLVFIPLIILFSACVQVSTQWLIRNQKFKLTAKVTFYQSFLLNTSKIGFGFFSPAASVLITIAALGHLLNALMLIYYSINTKLRSVKNMFRINFKDIKKVAKQHKDFPLYRAPQILLNASSQGLPVLMLSAFLGPAFAGFYSIGRTVLGFPSKIIGKAIGDVFYPRITQAYNRGELLYPLLKKSTAGMAIVGAIPFGIFILFGPYLFSLIFGNDWDIAGEYARWMAMWTYVAFFNKPSLMALPVLKAQRFHLLHEIASTLIRVVSLFIGLYFFKNDMLAIILFSVTGIILNLYLVYFTLKKSKKLDNEQKIA